MRIIKWFYHYHVLHLCPRLFPEVLRSLWGNFVPLLLGVVLTGQGIEVAKPQLECSNAMIRFLLGQLVIWKKFKRRKWGRVNIPYEILNLQRLFWALCGSCVCSLFSHKRYKYTSLLCKIYLSIRSSNQKRRQTVYLGSPGGCRLWITALLPSLPRS